MFKDLANNIKAAIIALKYHKDWFALVEKVTIDEMTAPRYYEGKGNYIDILDFESGGRGYLRKAGKIQFNEVLGKGVTSCADNDYLIEISIPFRAVSYLERSALKCDDAFSDDLHTAELIGVLSGKPSGLALELNAHSVRYKPTSTTTNPEALWHEEVSGINYRVPVKYSFVAVDFMAVLIIDSNCLTDVCY